FFTITKFIYNLYAETFSMDQWNKELKAVVLYRIDAIYYGVLAAILSLVKSKLWERRASLLLKIGAALFLALQLVFQTVPPESYAFQSILNLLYLPITSISIALCLPFLSQLKTTKSFILKPITIISIISYSMYLLHYSIVLQVMRQFVVIEALSTLEKCLLSFAYISVTIILAYFLYRLYEKPMMDIRDRPFFRKSIKS
ncbi:MAG: peptidoglycan/LPS O-acetylase OafA/YrhL, partial [Candidatus Latescibacterota bacterium]